MDAAGWQECICELTTDAATAADQIHILASFIDRIQDGAFIEQIVVVAFTLFETIWVYFLRCKSIWTSWITERLIEVIVIVEWKRSIPLLLLFLFVVVTVVAVAIAEMMWGLFESITI